MSLFGGSDLNYGQLKTNLSLACNRLKLLGKKKTEISSKSRSEIANFIKEGKLDRARIRCEHIIREDYLVEVYESLEVICEILVTRFGLIQSQKIIDKGLEESIATVIWCGPRLQSEVPEFKVINDIFGKKYGKPFVQECISDAKLKVKRDVMKKLNVEAIATNLIEMYMSEIAKSFGVAFEPDPKKMAGEFTSTLIDMENTQIIPPDADFGFCLGMANGPLFPGAPCPPLHPNGGPSVSNFVNNQDKSYPSANSSAPSMKYFKNLSAEVYDDLYDYPEESVSNNNKDSPPPAYNMNMSPDLKLPTATISDDKNDNEKSAPPPPPDDEDLNFDELSRRFENLKRK